MQLPGWDRETSPYHEGEQTLHDRLGRKAAQAQSGRRVHRPYMPDQHREFFSHLPFVVVGSIDRHGWPWASILFGRPGFISTPDDRTLRIDARPLAGDPLAGNMESGAPLGFLGIELPTRRRNRVNGVVSKREGPILDVSVVQSYGNCPQYIQARDMDFIRDPEAPIDIPLESFTALDGDAVRVIEKADTFFVASYNDRDDKHGTGGADVSHRGGKPDFIKVESNTLTIPDFAGNFAFNTFGNFLLNPKAGLIFIDFDSGDIWQLTGSVELIWDMTDELKAFRGAERGWRFHLDHGLCLRSASPWRWQSAETSPNTRLTGDWQEAERNRAAEATRAAWRPFRVTAVEDESSVIRSFYLEPLDGVGLADYKPGQFLTIRVAPEGGGHAIRTYTLSSAPSDDGYRISVKREPDGLVSTHLHEHVMPGDVIDVRAPNGSFWLDTRETRPAVLIAGGVGITPMIAMARDVLHSGVRHRHLRPLTIFHAARTTAERGFAGEFGRISAATNGAVRYISVTGQPAAGEEQGRAFDQAGRIGADTLQRHLPLADYDFYLCGPEAFMQAIYDLVRALGVRDTRIFAESFGPASLDRQADASGAERLTDFEPVTSAVVTFKNAQVEETWAEADGTLLEFAEAHGLNPNYGCRSGACGSCAVRVASGRIGYVHQPTYQPDDGDVLLCCAVPAASDDALVLNL